MNILLTCVGRRSYIVNYFKDAVKSSGKVIAANSEPITAGMIVADKSYVVPGVSSPKYIPKLLEICKDEKIKMVVSLFDVDLLFLSKERDKFIKQGIQLVVSDSWVIEIANDKWKTNNFLKEKSLATPRTFLSMASAKRALYEDEVNFPLIIKPRWGMGSLSIFKADNERELSFFYNFAQKNIKKSYLNILSQEELGGSVIIQEYIDGKEYGLDVFNDLEGNYLKTFVKEKLAMRSGETDIARVIEDPRLTALGSILANHFRHRGNMDVDVLENKSGELFVLEMNARFGGGYPFSHLAGANLPLALVDMVNGNEPRGVNDIEYDTVGLKSLGVIKANI
ncbi:MAG: ATP-grasp domain-containing protein [Perlabentimonas sp.]